MKTIVWVLLEAYKQINRNIVGKIQIFSIVFIFLGFTHQAHATPGIAYTGKILKGDVAVESGVIRFDIWIKTNDSCILYYERRDIDMSGSKGIYAFDIGSTGALTPAFGHASITSLSDVFDNSKTYASGLLSGGAGCGAFNPAADEGRLLTVTFTPPGDVAQSLPDLTLAAVPMALQAFNANKVNGYGTGELLKVSSAVNQTTYTNSALNQAQYDEFWKLILGTSTTYLNASSAVGSAQITDGSITNADIGDVAWGKITGEPTTLAGYGITDSLVKNNGVTPGISAGNDASKPGTPATGELFVAVDAGKIYRWDGTATWDVVATKSGTVAGTASLASGQIWVGNASGIAQAFALSGDATMDNTGAMTLNTVAVGKGGTGTTTGSITGTGALTFAAGGANSDITLTPTGTGKVIISSKEIQLTSSGTPAAVEGAACGTTGTITRDDNGDLYVCK